MEEVLLRFPHIGEAIFDSLSEETVEKCRKVSKIWKNFIEGPNEKWSWIQMIKQHEKDSYLKKFVSHPQSWRKLSIQDLRRFAGKHVNNCVIS